MQKVSSIRLWSASFELTYSIKRYITIFSRHARLDEELPHPLRMLIWDKYTSEIYLSINPFPWEYTKNNNRRWGKPSLPRWYEIKDATLFYEFGWSADTRSLTEVVVLTKKTDHSSGCRNQYVLSRNHLLRNASSVVVERLCPSIHNCSEPNYKSIKTQD